LSSTSLRMATILPVAASLLIWSCTGWGRAGQFHVLLGRKKFSVDVKAGSAVPGVGVVSDLVVVETLMNLAVRAGLPDPRSIRVSLPRLRNSSR